MSNMDEATAFFTSFFELESELVKANLGGEKTFDALYAALLSMLAAENVHPIQREDVSDLMDEFKEANENARKAVAPRQLFAVAQYAVGKRTLFCAFASEHRKAGANTAIMEKFWADDTMHVVATYFRCTDCGGTGHVRATKCPDCKGKGWFQASGEKIKVAKPIAVKKLQRPTDPAAAEQYDAL